MEGLVTKTEQLRVMAHPTRMHIIDMLGAPGVGQLCVKDIGDKLGDELGIVSQHLILMRDRRMLTSHKQGTRIFYSLAHPWLYQVVQHIVEI